MDDHDPDKLKPKFKWPTITSTHLAALACLALTLLAALVAPGAVAFGADEAALVGKALLANRSEVAATNGLVGTFGVPYGPVPTWIYQYLLSLTHDPVSLVSLRAGVFLLTLGAAMLSLAKSLRITPWIAPAVLALPWVWWHARQPWDNSFLIPFSAVALAGLARVAKSASPVALLVTILACGAMLSTHLMSVPVVGAIGLCLVVSCRKTLIAHLPTALCGIAIVFGTHWMYLSKLLRGGAVASAPTSANGSPSTLVQLPGIFESLTFPFSGQLLAGQSPLVDATLAAWIGTLAILAGAALTVRRIILTRRADQIDAADALRAAPATQRGVVLRELEHRRESARLDPAVVVPMVAIAALAFTGVFFAIARPGLFGHYLHAVLVPAVLLAGVAFSAIRSSGVRASIGTAYLLAMLSITALLATKSVGATVIGRETPTLATLDAIARDLHESSARTVRTPEPFLQRHPGVLRTLIALKAASDEPNEVRPLASNPDRVLRFAKPAPEDDRTIRRINLTGPIDLPQYDATSMATVE
jgi:hypothetical protein